MSGLKSTTDNEPENSSVFQSLFYFYTQVLKITNKEKYKKLCASEKSISLFMRHDWLNTVVGEDGWDVVLVEQSKDIVAAMPFVHKKKAGFKIITMPVMTPYLGVWMKYPKGQKYTNKLSYELSNYEQLISRLPKFDYYIQYLHYENTNWLPFHWQKFQQTTRYTYLLKNLKNPETIFANFRENVRREIKKAEKSLKVAEDISIEEFYDIQTKAYKAKKKKLPFSKQYLTNIIKHCVENNCGKFLYAFDKELRINAAIFIVWDTQACHYLVGGVLPKYRTSCAISLLLWQAIQFAAQVSRSFNFEGSMIQPIERYFRAFGGVQTPYFQISKTNSPLLKVRETLIDLYK